jgi:hypothetical protein
MDVFIGNLPASGRLVELEVLLAGLPVHSRFERRIGLDSLDKNYHFIVISTASDAQAQALIERLDGLYFEGNRLIAREYVRRGKDTSAPADWDGAERRINPVTSE